MQRVIQIDPSYPIVVYRGNVTEPNPAGGTFISNYTYTPANQLTGVSMTRGNVTQTRTFVYNGSDLTSAANPENGTVTYVYDNSRHVIRRTGAFGSQTVYTYDSRFRVLQGHRGPQPTGDHTPAWPAFATQAWPTSMLQFGPTGYCEIPQGTPWTVIRRWRRCGAPLMLHNFGGPERNTDKRSELLHRAHS